MTTAPSAAGADSPASRTIQINPAVALTEKLALIQHYENRNLALAQQLQEARQALEKANAALAAVEVANDKNAEAADTEKKD
ncbi:hypothetical protein [Synechococcus phage Ssp-JY39]|nr:hypothetical protein [Synechococcus phage Yong-M2-251]